MDRRGETAVETEIEEEDRDSEEEQYLSARLGELFSDNPTPAEPQPPQQQQRVITPFHRRYASAPPTQDLQLEHDLRQLQQVILTRLDNTKTKSNLTPSQREGLRSLLKRKHDLHISVSDKGGEFVVIDSDLQKSVTNHHINDMSTKGVYKHVPPMRTMKGRTQPVAKPSDYTYSNLISQKCKNLESDANCLWNEISERVGFDKKFSDLFIARDTQLPTLYILMKTHKYCR
eukprot:sb/3469407/